MGSTGSKGSRLPAALPDPGICTAIQHVKTELTARHAVVEPDPKGKERKEHEQTQLTTKHELPCDKTQMSDEQAYLKKCKDQDHDTKTKRRSLSLLESPKRKARTPEDVRTARKFSDVQRDRFNFGQQSMMKLSYRKKVQLPATKETEKRKTSIVRTKKEKNRSGGKHSVIKAKTKSPSTAASQFVTPLPCDDDYTNFEPTDAVSRPARAE